MSHIWTLGYRSTSWNSCGSNICRKFCYRPSENWWSRVPGEQKGSTDYHYNLWLTVCFTMRYHQWRVPEVLFPALTAWKLKLDTFSEFLEFSGGCNSEIMFQKECLYKIVISCILIRLLFHVLSCRFIFCRFYCVFYIHPGFVHI